MNNRNCTTCKYGYLTEIKDTVCVCDKSDMCCDFVDKNNICNYWEVNLLNGK